MEEKEKIGFAWEECSTFLECKMNDVWNRNPTVQPYADRRFLIIILAILTDDWESQEDTWTKPSFS